MKSERQMNGPVRQRQQRGMLVVSRRTRLVRWVHRLPLRLEHHITAQEGFLSHLRIWPGGSQIPWMRSSWLEASALLSLCPY